MISRISRVTHTSDEFHTQPLGTDPPLPIIPTAPPDISLRGIIFAGAHTRSPLLLNIIAFPVRIEVNGNPVVLFTELKYLPLSYWWTREGFTLLSLRLVASYHCVLPVTQSPESQRVLSCILISDYYYASRSGENLYRSHISRDIVVASCSSTYISIEVACWYCSRSFEEENAIIYSSDFEDSWSCCYVYVCACCSSSLIHVCEDVVRRAVWVRVSHKKKVIRELYEI